MRSTEWTGRFVAWTAMALVTSGLVGCKTLNERYIALEVWKYEKCFGHLPPGFVPPGAAQAPGRVCGQSAGCPNACPPATAGCDSCGGGTVVEGGMPMPASMPAAAGAPSGIGGSPAASSLPTPAGVTTGKPVIISDEVVMPAS